MTNKKTVISSGTKRGGYKDGEIIQVGELQYEFNAPANKFYVLFKKSSKLVDWAPSNVYLSHDEWMSNDGASASTPKGAILASMRGSRSNVFCTCEEYRQTLKTHEYKLRTIDNFLSSVKSKGKKVR